MTRAQRAVRLLIWILLPVLVVAAVGAIAGTQRFGFGQQREWLHVRSPTGEYQASLVEESASCGQSFSASRTSVFVERRWGFLKTGTFSPFCVASDADLVRVRIRWQGPETLLVECRGCPASDVEATDTNWGKLHFIFDLDEP